MTIIFFGNTKFSAIGERIIHEKLGIHTVVTIPDKLDKKDRPMPSPTKQYALEQHIPVIEVTRLTTEVINQIAALQPDFFVVEDYGLILPQRLLNVPKYAPINIHHSLLPKYRGSSPAPTAILNGENTSGVTVIHMTNTVDAGAIYGQQPYDLQPDETTESLLTVLNTIGATMAAEIIPNIAAGVAKPLPQDESKATFTKMMQKSDGYVAISNPPTPTQLDRMIRAYYPWPGVWTRLKVQHETEKMIKFLPNNQIQVEGKKPMTLKDFYNGYPELKDTIEELLGGK